MNIQFRDSAIYEFAKRFLTSIPGIGFELVNSYLESPILMQRPNSLAGIYQQLLASAQNANMKAGVIGGSIGGVTNFGKVLFDFQPRKVLSSFSTWQEVLTEIETKLRPRGQIRREPRSLWPKYCQTVLSAAQFVSQFDSAGDFYSWVDFFENDSRARLALPLLLESEIEGIGFALACDFLKELGYCNFGKPDVHIRDIFTELELCPQNASDIALFKSIVRISNHSGATPYSVDKVFWLIGSGYFHDNPELGNQGRIGSKKREFISQARNIFENAGVLPAIKN